MSNPLMTESAFEKVRTGFVSDGESMTLKGTVNKTILLFITMLVPAAWIWMKLGGDPTQAVGLMPFMIGSLVIGLIASIVLVFKKSWAPVLAPVYAAAEGVFLGIISMIYEHFQSGIVVQAVGITLLLFAAMLVAYRTGLIRATPLFTKIIVFATLGVGLFYLINMIVMMFGVESFYMGSSLLSIGVSVLIAGIAAFNFILNFDMIENQAQLGAPKYMEWYSGFGLLLTLVWLYLEILRLLSKISGRD
ncbi:MAG: Bax inhibitor-1/YccA family protein [Bacteroidetes bacterium]|nr:Bax inhibitor-1/YccA family protein [Bacteroidota bacterium]